MAETVISREAPDIEAMKLALMQAGIDLTKEGMTLPQQQIADMSGLQKLATQYAGQGIGSYMPFLQGAGDLYGQSTAKFDPSSYQQFMDPYTQEVINQQYADINRLGTQQQQGLSDSAVQAGAFGGGRQAIGSAEIGRNVLDQQARTGGQLRSQGFQQAMGTAASNFQNRMGRLGSAAGGLASLGASIPGLKQQELGFLFDMGSREQAQQQAGLDALYQNQLKQQMEPYQRLGFLSDIFQGAPSSQMQFTTGTAPGSGVSPFQQYLGYGIGGLSAVSGANKLGLFG
jgi:hypothetical protein|tara:strand:- start:5551 stop:6408 length:858 start_codon:yes stop_codon:yes gene_type:complete